MKNEKLTIKVEHNGRLLDCKEVEVDTRFVELVICGCANGSRVMHQITVIHLGDYADPTE